MKKNKVLIFGGGGFIGLNLAKFLSNQRNVELTLADTNFPRDFREYFEPSAQAALRIVKKDFTNPQSFRSLDSDFNQVYMLASVVGVNNTLSAPDEVIRINTMLIMNCLEWLKASSVERVLFSSTSEAYAGAIDALGSPIPTGETVPLAITDIREPRFAYAATKMLGESAFFSYARRYDFQATVVRYHNAFGPDMGFKHVIPHLVERFVKGEQPFQMYGHNQTRAFSFVDDTVAGTVSAMEHPAAAGEIFHIGSDKEITIEELIRATGDLCGFSGEYVNAPTYPGSVARRCPDISKAREVLGYAPKVSWQDGLARTVEWYLNYFHSHDVVRSDGFKSRDEVVAEGL